MATHFMQSAFNIFPIKNRAKKLMQAQAIYACIRDYTWWLGTSIVYLQSHLYVPWRLSAGNLSHRRSQTHVRSIVLRMIESVDEVGPELHSEPLCDLEVFMHTEIQVGVTRRAQTCELRCAVSEGSSRRLNKVSVVDEPLSAYAQVSLYL